MKFSICIPNYNYGSYIGRTIESVRAQTGQDLEILVSDNASTDNSVAVVEQINDPRIRTSVNRWNVGFASNLDRAARGASGDFMIMLSSDDLMGPGALAAYERVFNSLGESAHRAVIASAVRVVDQNDVATGMQNIDWKLWAGAKRDESLSKAAGADVWRLPAKALLRRSLKLLRSPLPFLSTCYPRALYDAVEGYGGQRIINPDKWFIWKILAVAEDALIIDAPLFSYRWHPTNQNAQQRSSGALKHMIDQYAFTFETPPAVLRAGGLTQADLAEAFIEQDVALRGLLFLASGDRESARRGLALGKAAYARLMSKNTKVLALRALLLLGPVGTLLARAMRDRAMRKWTDQLANIQGSD